MTKQLFLLFISLTSLSITHAAQKHKYKQFYTAFLPTTEGENCLCGNPITDPGCCTKVTSYFKDADGKNLSNNVVLVQIGIYNRFACPKAKWIYLPLYLFRHDNGTFKSEGDTINLTNSFNAPVEITLGPGFDDFKDHGLTDWHDSFRAARKRKANCCDYTCNILRALSNICTAIKQCCVHAYCDEDSDED